MNDEEDLKQQLVGHFWDSVRSFFEMMWQKVWGDWLSFIPAAYQRINDDWDERCKRENHDVWTLMRQFLVKEGMLNDQIEELFSEQQEMSGGIGRFLGLITYLVMMSGYTSTYLPALMSTGRQKANMDLLPELADAATYIKAAFTAPERMPEIIDGLHRLGLSDKQIELIFISNYRTYDENMCKELFLRNIIDADKLFERMREIGYTDTRIKEMMQTWNIIPGPQDLFYMVGKEAFEPDMIKHIGLDQEFPDEQMQWLEKQGISRYWAEKYWAAHWDQPSVQMGYEMLHRRVINDEELDMLFRAVEMPQFWREKLKQISYMPYTRVDVRRMRALQLISVEEVYENYLDQGYDPDHALQMTKFTETYVDPEDKSISKSEILSAYEDKILNEAEAKTLINQLGYNVSQTDFIIISKDYEIAKKMSDARVKLIKDKYLLRIQDKFDTRRDLNLLNLESNQIENYLELWDLEIIKDYKFPSKTDLEKFYAEKIIDEKIYREEMNRLGYSNKYTNWYFKLLQTKVAGE